MKVELPYPHPDLSPNGRVNHFALARRKKAYRTGCGWECVTQGVKPITADRLNVTVTFRPPNRHHRDVDNALASIKSGLDALSDALGDTLPSASCAIGFLATSQREVVNAPVR